MKKVISLLLLAVYLFAAGGPAYASLSCRCVWAKSSAVHACCRHGIDHTGDLPAAKADVSAPCCGNHHSTEIALYTVSPDSDKVTRCAVLLLPPALVAGACIECIEAVTTSDKVAERRTPFVSTGFTTPTGLRAPPVLA